VPICSLIIAVNTTVNTVVSNCESTVNHTQLAKETTWTDNNQDYVKPLCDDGLLRYQDGAEGPPDNILQECWSCLKYVEVDDGVHDTITAQNDSGCQLCVVRVDAVRSLNLPKLGEAKLKGISDHLVPADIVRIRDRLTTGREFVNITCAVVEKLNYGLILGSDIVDKLNLKLTDEEFDVNEVTNVIHYDDDDDDVDENDVTNDNSDSENDENQNMSDPLKASAEVLKKSNGQTGHELTVGLWQNVKELVITYETESCIVIISI